MVIRRAQVSDLPRIVEMGREFLDTLFASEVLGTPDPARMTRTAAWLLEADDRYLSVVENGEGGLSGMLGMFVYAHPMTGARTAVEMFWWMDPAARGLGVRLLHAGLEWAKGVGATKVQLIAPTVDVERFYQRLGFAKVESTYARAL